MSPAGRSDGRARTVFFGSGSFGLAGLDAALGLPTIEVVAVVSAPDRAAGRHGRLTAVPVAARARELGIPLLQPARLRAPEGTAAIAALAPDLGLLADYGQIVPARLVDLPPQGILNVHPSLLPRHRGASPVPGAILAGDRETGVSLIRMDAGLDTGPVVAAVRHALSGHETAPDLERTLAGLLPALLRDAVPAWLAGRIAAVPQDDAAATMTRPLRREDGRLDQRRTAAALERQVRAYQPWPGSFVEAEGLRVVVWAARPVDAAQSAAMAGTLVPVDGGVGLATTDGILEFLEVQPAGGRRMSGAELVRGHPVLIGASSTPAPDRPADRHVG